MQSPVLHASKDRRPNVFFLLTQFNLEHSDLRQTYIHYILMYMEGVTLYQQQNYHYVDGLSDDGG